MAGIHLYPQHLGCFGRYTKKQMARHAELSKDNITDTMTGLYNRKVLNDALSHKIDAALAKHIPVTLVSIDSDGLKKINDTLDTIWQIKYSV